MNNKKIIESILNNNHIKISSEDNVLNYNPFREAGIFTLRSAIDGIIDEIISSIKSRLYNKIDSTITSQQDYFKREEVLVKSKIHVFMFNDSEYDLLKNFFNEIKE